MTAKRPAAVHEVSHRACTCHCCCRHNASVGQLQVAHRAFDPHPSSTPSHALARAADVAAISLNNMLHSPQLAGECTEHTVYRMCSVPRFSKRHASYADPVSCVGRRKTSSACRGPEHKVQPGLASSVSDLRSMTTYMHGKSVTNTGILAHQTRAL